MAQLCHSLSCVPELAPNFLHLGALLFQGAHEACAVAVRLGFFDFDDFGIRAPMPGPTAGDVVLAVPPGLGDLAQVRGVVYRLKAVRLCLVNRQSGP